MATPSAIKVILTPEFKSDIKKLEKSYPSVVDAVKTLIKQLESGARPGNRIREVDLDVYKARLPNRSARRGKSGGFRVYYLVQPTDATARIFLITIYSKTDHDDINISVLRRLLQSVQ